MYSLLELKNISKNFGAKQIYQNLSFQFDKGCHAIIGPNGIGKTVLLEMIAGVAQQTNGMIALTGIGINTSQAYKRNLIYVPHEASFFPTATGANFLNFILSVRKVHPKSTRLPMLIETFKLSTYLNVTFKNMSLGTKRKFFLATLLIGDSSLLVMDEPTNGLDKECVKLLATLVNDLSREKIFIFTTHDQFFLSQVNPHLIKLDSTPISEFRIERESYVNQIL